MKSISVNHYQTSGRYYKLSKLLFESERYKDMKLEVKVAYAVLNDRLELPLSKGWIDEDGSIYEFEVILEDNQIEKEVDDGLFIKVSFGVKQDGLVFIPNYQVDTIEVDQQKKYKIYVRETSSYFIYNKENSDKNRYIQGRTLISQLTYGSKNIPYRRSTITGLQEKVAEINLLVTLIAEDKNFEQIKADLIKEIAELDIQLEQAQEKINTLNKMAESLINLNSNDIESVRLAKYELARLNVPDSISVKQVNKNLVQYQKYFNHIIDNYDQRVRKLEQFSKIIASQKDNVDLAEIWSLRNNF